MTVKHIKDLALLNHSEIEKQMEHLKEQKKKMLQLQKKLDGEALLNLQNDLDEIDQMIEDLEYSHQEYLDFGKETINE